MNAVIKHGDLIQKLLDDTDESLEFDSVLDLCRIYRVPENIRRGNEELYTPLLISIGPLHHGTPKLAVMENKKKQYLKSCCERTKTENIDRILSFIEDNERTIRACYAEASTLESLEFVIMILYDSISIIELFLRERFQDRSDISPNKISLCRDLQLFENQLPYFVLEKIYKLAFDVSYSNPSLMELSCYFFGDTTSVEHGCYLSRLTEGESVKHFTDWKRITLLKSDPGYAELPKEFSGELPKEFSGERVYNLPCAVKLHESGVKFIRKKIAKNIFDIKFKKRKQLIPFFKVDELQIPQLSVNKWTQGEFGNIIALEQCLYPDNALVCNYVELMAHLINTKEDVDLLDERGIISNQTGDNVLVANMFKKFNVLAGPTSYNQVCADLKRHYNNPWNRVKVNLKIGTLKRVYFNNPWKGAATVAAIILLLLTVVQTICSILQVT
ncbi:UPF0481 protein At3g47200-like [Mangifera indica]|uniref:UPF0481 protein At3g47200-like n=1 Tax=Mangifera indica TaxID=29780 RepID=UPI001CFB3691|nr:UPF0481 protein At3g47200-like [Mangifera indica]